MSPSSPVRTRTRVSRRRDSNVVQLDLFGWFTGSDIAAWELAERYFEVNHPAWKSMHPTDLARLIADRWDQEGIYSIYVEIMTRHKLAKDLVTKAYLRRTGQAFYLAMDGAVARRTFEDEFRRTISRPMEMRIKEIR